MTADEAIAIVKSKSSGRTRYEGRPDYIDEVLVNEIERLRAKLEDCTNRYCNLLDQLGAGADM